MNNFLPGLSAAQLLEYFIEVSMREDEAVNVADISRMNEAAGKVYEISKELERREGDQRSLLVALFSHTSMRVRFNAAKVVFNLMPVEARRQIEAIANSKEYPVAGNAGVYLFMHDEFAKKS